MKTILLLLFALLAPAFAEPGEAPENLDRLALKLGDPDYEERERAQARMKTLFTDGMKKGEALESIRTLWRTDKDPEVRARLFALGSELFIQQKGSLFGFRFMIHRQLKIDDQFTITISIEEVIAQSPAMKAGLQKGDLVVGVNDELLGSRSLEDILVFFRRLPPEKTHKLRVRRGEEDLFFKIRPDPQELTADDKRFLQDGFKKWLYAEKEV